MGETLPLATIQTAVLEFLRGRDLAMLLLTFPELKTEASPVAERLKAANAGSKIMSVWHDLVAQEIAPPVEDDKFA